MSRSVFIPRSSRASALVPKEISCKCRQRSRQGRRSGRRFGNDGVLVLVSRGATAKQFQYAGTGVPDLMVQPRRNRDGISSPDLPDFFFDSHSPLAPSDEINLFRDLMKMLLRAAARLNPGFSETLLADNGIAVSQ